MINEFSITRLHNAEFVQFITSALTFVNAAGAVVNTAIAAQKTALSDSLTQLSNIFVTDPASPLTDDLAALDTQRDDYLTGLTMYCRAFTYHPNASYRSAAQTLLRNIEIYGENIQRQTYNAESATITNLLDDWANRPELEVAANTISAAAFVDALSTANTSFITNYNNRTAVMASEATPDNVKALRAQVTGAWKTLRKKIDANTELAENEAPWGPLVAQLNTLIDQYRQLLLVRAGHAAAQEEDPQQS